MGSKAITHSVATTISSASCSCLIGNRDIAWNITAWLAKVCLDLSHARGGNCMMLTVMLVGLLVTLTYACHQTLSTTLASRVNLIS